MRKLIDGDYTVPYSSECDNGYGTESAADEVTIYVLNGDVDEVIAYGMHFINETEIDWSVDLTDQECIELLQQHCPHAFGEYTRDELLDIEADKALDIYKNS